MTISTANIKPFFYEVLDGFASAGGIISAKLPKEVVAEEKEQEQELAPPLAPTFSLEELEIAKNLAHEEGISKGYADAKAAFEREQEEKNTKLSELTAKLLEQVALMNEQIRQRQSLLSKEFADMAISAAKIVCNNIDESTYSGQLEGYIKQSLEQASDAGNIKIFLNPKNATELNDKFTGMAVNANEEIAIGDFRIEWQNGYSERDTSKIWEGLEQIMTKHFNNKGE